jgi:GAF domain-containing protein
VLEQGSKTIQAEAGTFFEVASESKAMRAVSAHGIDVQRLQEAPLRVGTGISGWVADHQQPALVIDVRQDPRFTRMVDLITGFQTRSVIAVPVLSQHRASGVLEYLNRKNNQFTLADQEFLSLLAQQSSIAAENLVLLDEISHTKVLLESLLGNMSGGLIAIDLKGKLTIINPAAVSILHLAEGNYLGKEAKHVLRPLPWFLQILQDTLALKTTVSRQDATQSIAGENVHVGYSTILISDPQKTVLGSGIIFQKLSS